MMNSLGMNNEKDSRVKLIFVPCYLTGHDGIFDLSIMISCWVTICAFIRLIMSRGAILLWRPLLSKCLGITTDLAGFGLWANQVKGDSEIEDEESCSSHGL